MARPVTKIFSDAVAGHLRRPPFTVLSIPPLPLLQLLQCQHRDSCSHSHRPLDPSETLAPPAMLRLLAALLALAAALGTCWGQASPAGAGAPAPEVPAGSAGGAPVAEGPSSFVSVQGGRFWLDSREWFMTGTNIYYLAQRAADVNGTFNGRPRPAALPLWRCLLRCACAFLSLLCGNSPPAGVRVDTEQSFAAAAAMGLNVIRTAACEPFLPEFAQPGGAAWEARPVPAHSLHRRFHHSLPPAPASYHPCSTNADGPDMWNAIQPAPGQLNETILREGLDYTVRWERGEERGQDPERGWSAAAVASSQVQAWVQLSPTTGPPACTLPTTLQPRMPPRCPPPSHADQQLAHRRKPGQHVAVHGLGRWVDRPTGLELDTPAARACAAVTACRWDCCGVRPPTQLCPVADLLLAPCRPHNSCAPPSPPTKKQTNSAASLSESCPAAGGGQQSDFNTQRGPRALRSCTAVHDPCPTLLHPPPVLPAAGGSQLSDFYTQPGPRELYKQYISAILGRRNTYTGRLYSEEPCILGCVSGLGAVGGCFQPPAVQSHVALPLLLQGSRLCGPSCCWQHPVAALAAQQEHASLPPPIHA